MTVYVSPFDEKEHPADPLWNVGGFRIVRCRDTRLVYVSNPLSDEDLARFYSVGYFEGDASRKGYASYESDEPVLRRNFRILLRHVLDEIGDAAGLSLLDYGCAYGYFLDEARQYFQSVRGTELNEEVAGIGRRRFGLTIDAGSKIELAPESLDVITLWDVIEHLSRPRAVLEACARALKPNGRLFLTTGDIGSPLARALGPRWRLINPPQHITYFAEDTLRGLLEKCGFEVSRVERLGKHVSLGFFLFVARYLIGRPVTSKESGWLSRKTLYINLFDTIFVSARRL